MVALVSWEGGLAVNVLVFTLVIWAGTAKAFFTPPWGVRILKIREKLFSLNYHMTQLVRRWRCTVLSGVIGVQR